MVLVVAVVGDIAVERHIACLDIVVAVEHSLRVVEHNLRVHSLRALED